MNVSLKWLGDHLDLSGRPLGELEDLLTFAGIEVEGVHSLPDHLVVAQILSSEKHRDADKLSVCQVDDGSGTPRQIVCGAKNYAVGDKVPLALPGCSLDAGEGKTFEIKEGKLRGVDSLGMLCSAGELGLPSEVDGLMILPPELAPGTPMSEVHPAVFELEITPNRPDCLSHLGVARELAALAGLPLKGEAHHGNDATPTRAALDSEIALATPGCPYYTARIIKGVRVGPSPAWMQERLEAVGLRPINNLVDITNYVLLEMGQPLHVFDLDKLQGGIELRSAAPGETFLALDGESYELAEGDLVVADQSGPVALGGVMGGEDSGVDETTTSILLEAAYFDPASVRRTARRLGLHSDSSYRFERGVDPHQILGASALATRLILELAGGEAEESVAVRGELPAPPPPVPLDNERCRALIGAPISDEEIAAILGSLGLRAEKGADPATPWAVPTYRRDLERPVDLIEEVARVYGLERVPSRQRAWFSPASKADRSYDFLEALSRRFVALGFYEARSLKLVSAAQLADDLASPHRGMGPVRLKNPLNDEQDYLRPGILPGLLAVAERNRRFGKADLRLFEAGRVFTATPKGDEIEHEHLALLMTGARAPRFWGDGGKAAALDLHDLRAALEAVLPPGLRLAPAEAHQGEAPALLCRCAIELGSGKKAQKLGVAGIVPPARARELGFEQPIYVAELNLKKLAAAHQTEPRFAELPRFPGSARDIAMLLPAELPAGAVTDFIAAHDEPLLVGSELFDLFTDPGGDKLPAGKKSLAYSIQYRASDRTLATAEVESAHAKLLDSLKAAFDVEFR